jgi:hypothetical protein
MSQSVFGQQFARANVRDVLQALHRGGLLVRMGNKYVSNAPIRSSAPADREYVYRIRGSILEPLSAARSASASSTVATMMIRDAPFASATAAVVKARKGVGHRHRAVRIPCPFQEALD